MGILRFAAILMLLTAIATDRVSALPPPSNLPAVESLAPNLDAPGPDAIWSESMVWGTIRYTWKVERGGEGRIRRVNEPELTFAVSADDFDRIHAMASHQRLTSRREGRCQPGPTDGPYGSFHWRIGGEHRELHWSSGYECSNTDFVYERLGAADDAVWELARRAGVVDDQAH